MNHMVYFFVNCNNNDIQKLQTNLPKDCFCLFQLQPSSRRYYGIIKKTSAPLLPKALSEESVPFLEYVDENAFKLFFLQNVGDTMYCIGNRRLLIHLSDE
jgi:hypothetical protein